MMIKRGDYPALEQFIGGWFHQDWADDGESIEDVVRSYMSVTDPVEVRVACLEMDAFLKRFGPASDVAFAQISKSFDPAGLGFTIPAFFEELKRILRS